MNLNKNNFILMTIHRYQTIDNYKEIKKLLGFLKEIAQNHKIVFCIHNRTFKNIKKFGLGYILANKNILITKPLKFSDFSALLINSKIVITDSGGVQEEANFHSKKTLVLRDKNERDDLIDKNNFIRSSIDNLLKNFKKITNSKNKVKKNYNNLVSNKIFKIIYKKLKNN